MAENAPTQLEQLHARIARYQRIHWHVVSLDEEEPRAMLYVRTRKRGRPPTLGLLDDDTAIVHACRELWFDDAGTLRERVWTPSADEVRGIVERLRERQA